MTNEEAIKILKFESGYFCDFKGCQEQQAFTMAIKALEQTDILDKIRAEIEEIYLNISYKENHKVGGSWGLRKAMEIIDKHIAESEG